MYGCSCKWCGERIGVEEFIGDHGTYCSDECYYQAEVKPIIHPDAI